MIKKDMKPCPFCGGKAEIYSDEEWFYVRCADCWAQTDGYDTEITARTEWNMRVATRPKGSWLRYDEEESNAWQCSVCHEVWQLMDGTPAENGMNYCQHCGAEMTMPDTETMNAPQ